MSPGKFLCLTERQAEVLELVSQDLRDKEVASRLKCSPLTVRAHLQAAFIKLGVRGRVGAAIAWDRAVASHKATSHKSQSRQAPGPR